MSFRVAIVGSRDYPQPGAVRGFVRSLAAEHQDLVIVSGGARGVDLIAEGEARKLGVPVKVWPADWERHGRRAGYLRNVKIVADSNRVVAFWDGTSRGTAHTVGIARDHEKLWKVFDAEGKETKTGDENGPH